jgi:hypothetical protein
VDTAKGILKVTRHSLKLPAMAFLRYLHITLFKKSKFESGHEAMIQSEILVELVIEIVETHY